MIQRAKGGASPYAAILMATVLFGPWGEARASVPDHLEAGVTAYQRAMASEKRAERLALFAEAERHFAAAIEGGADSADLHVNHGNAALQAEHLGPAILAYRRALARDPSHPGATQNLGHARSLLPDWVPHPTAGGLADSFFFWQREASRDQLALVAALLFFGGCASLALALVRGGRAWRSVAMGGFGLWLALLVSDGLGTSREDPDALVVVAEESAARAADSINAPRRFSEPLPGGTELRLIEDRGGWVQVELYNGRRAWLLASTIASVETPAP